MFFVLRPRYTPHCACEYSGFLHAVAPLAGAALDAELQLCSIPVSCPPFACYDQRSTLEEIQFTSPDVGRA